MTNDNINHSPASLAYIGDAVFELLVRVNNINGRDVKAHKLHKETVKMVNASTQSKLATELLKIMSCDEQSIYRRGRNTEVHSMPRNANKSDYCKATGLEAVFGHLYLQGDENRINELFKYCIDRM